MIRKNIPFLILTIFTFYLIVALRISKNNEFNLSTFGQLPVIHEGRMKPLDSVARSSLLALHENQKLLVGERTVEPIEWFLQVVASSDLTDVYPVFTIHNPEVLTLLKLRTYGGKHFSYNELRPHIETIMSQAEAANEVEATHRSPFERAIITLANQTQIYFRMTHSFFVQSEGQKSFVKTLKDDFKTLEKGFNLFEAHKRGRKFSGEGTKILQAFQIYTDRARLNDQMSLIRPLAPNQLNATYPHNWQTMGTGMFAYLQTRQPHPNILRYAEALDHYTMNQPEKFNQVVNAIYDDAMKLIPSAMNRARFESFFNHYQPFIKSLVLYLISFLLIMGSWLVWKKELSSAGFSLMVLAFGLHTFALMARVFLQGRPPVTNLYSSAVFVGWVAILIGIYLERLFKNRMGTLVGSIIGVLTLIIAHHLSLQGDTLEKMQAVLDSNFWLSTHVITITIGYAGTFLSGILGVVFIFRNIITGKRSDAFSRDLHKMMYGIVCFSLLFSFVGTVLGGIWADQSWGRFWGWDPKENGALLIVMWNAIILHALRDKLITTKGLALACVFGNIVTAFSWFGVNMLGVGLHSYGFMDKAFLWLIIFIALNAMIIISGAWTIKSSHRR